ncbi:hypothetical protein ALP73_00990 [Pseudomonas coronafaciens pv. garcae]|uniref:Uncharacterized protein n=5 Tax=Pseudomonas syringae group TaxID=136849 RepID=A0AB37QWL2_9PSED|nr:Uncharacterized protein AC511_4603 [Pseudomonas coronafaciens pv. oryzae]KPX32508.1 Uncharacterized protein ALO77_03716 [Pseudomonas coronafaciens pv. garcae]KPY26654.1 Uncharacterized protein ALO89_00269 [Pseudomonas coronafaciens pv. porri]KPZ28606.1 Uncharacterized protein ALO38_01589 [Pseudomonas coronafaciens pv. zizaniae]RMM77481.1 hypothetical protein ALQ71_00926 [Pseudomonas coronafaciens pv. striafaciens]RMN93064.1 hypothetical protein ALQ50_03474 [Pseudomonas coronafaciens pv. cor
MPGFVLEALMKQWAILYLDKDGVQQRLEADFAARPSEEEVAQMLRKGLYPMTDELDLNDLDGRTAEPTVKTLKDHNSVEIISITEMS